MCEDTKRQLNRCKGTKKYRTRANFSIQKSLGKCRFFEAFQCLDFVCVFVVFETISFCFSAWNFGRFVLGRLKKSFCGLYKDDYFRLDIKEMVLAFDSSTIELCLKLCPWAEYKKKSGAMKMHTLLDLRGSIPTFIWMTEGKVNDMNGLDVLPVEAGAYYLMDKGYVDFWRLYNYFHLRQAYFVTRAKDNMRFEVKDEREVDMHAGLISDQSIRLAGPLVSKDYPEMMRMVVYEDFATNNVYRFLTNNFIIDALTVTELYRERWQIELFFKWIKQHLHVKSFFGTTKNAVFAQIWIAVCDYLLLAIAKKLFHIEQNLYIFSQAIGLVLFEKMPVSELFNRIDNSKLEPENDGQGWLF